MFHELIVIKIQLLNQTEPLSALSDGNEQTLLKPLVVVVVWQADLIEAAQHQRLD